MNVHVKNFRRNISQFKNILFNYEYTTSVNFTSIKTFGNFEILKKGKNAPLKIIPIEYITNKLRTERIPLRNMARFRSFIERNFSFDRR